MIFLEKMYAKLFNLGKPSLTCTELAKNEVNLSLPQKFNHFKVCLKSCDYFKSISMLKFLLVRKFTQKISSMDQVQQNLSFPQVVK